jgi:hypothetical protein
MINTKNTLFIILNIFISITSLSIKNVNTSSDPQLSVQPLLDIMANLKTEFKSLYDFTDLMLDEVFGKGVNNYPLVQFGNTLKEAFGTSLTAQGIPKKYTDFWIISIINKGKTVDRTQAHIAVQNSVLVAVFSRIFKKQDFKAKGSYAAQFNDLVERLYKVHLAFEELSGKFFVQADKDGNGSISLDEFKNSYAGLLQKGANVEKEFKTLDENKNGSLDPEEISHLLAKVLLKENPYFIVKA